jgi:hypothetical protein
MPQHDLLNYYTEPMKVPFYAVRQEEELRSIMDKWDMKPSFFLDPLTEVWAVKKPATQGYIVARIGSGAYKDVWGMIWSGHLRQARHMKETMAGQTLTGASYGVTKNTLEADAAVGDASPWRNTVAAEPHPAGPRCQRCTLPMRNHKLYESEEARALLVKIANKPKFPGQYMIGLLMVFDSQQSLTCIIGGESGWDGRQYKDAFEHVMLSSNSHRIWANEYLGLMDTKPENLGNNAKLRDWSGNSIPMAISGDTMQCAGPKLVQAYLKWDHESNRNQRGTDTLFMSEIWGAPADAKPNKKSADLATYGARQSASSCMRCRTEIPPMLCGKAPAIAKADMPHLLRQLSRD